MLTSLPLPGVSTSSVQLVERATDPNLAADAGEERPTAEAVKKTWQLLRRSAKDTEELIGARVEHQETVKKEEDIKAENIKSEDTSMLLLTEKCSISAAPKTPTTPKTRVARKPLRRSVNNDTVPTIPKSRKRKRRGDHHSEDSESSEAAFTDSEFEKQVDTPPTTPRKSSRMARKSRTTGSTHTSATASGDVGEEDERDVGALNDDFSDSDFQP
jgi:hypothetical protein